MPCFFCNSPSHLTEYCNIHVSDAERKEIAESKNCCKDCLIEYEKRKEFGHAPKRCNKQKCYICFSPRHSTVFCPDRLNLRKFEPKNFK